MVGGAFVVAFAVVALVAVVTVFVVTVTVVTVDDVEVLVVDVVVGAGDSVVVVVAEVGFSVVVVVVQIVHLPHAPGQKMLAIAGTPQLGSEALSGHVWWSSLWQQSHETHVPQATAQIDLVNTSVHCSGVKLVGQSSWSSWPVAQQTVSSSPVVVAAAVDSADAFSVVEAAVVVATVVVTAGAAVGAAVAGGGVVAGLVLSGFFG